MPVWVLARELGVSSQAILDECARMGWHDVTSHSQNLTADRVTRLREKFPKPVAEDSDTPPAPDAPTWVKIVGVSFLGLTLVFFMVMVLGGVPIHSGNCFPIVVVFSLGAAIGSGFLTGAAAIKGQIPIPGTEKKPIIAGASGGIAVLLIVFLVGYLLVCKNIDASNSVEVPADPKGMGSTEIVYDGKSDAIASVEAIWDSAHTNVIEFRVTFKPGKENGWFQAKHANKNSGAKDMVKYHVSLHNPDPLEDVEVTPVRY